MLPLFQSTRTMILASASPRRKALLCEVGLDLPVVLPSRFGPFVEPTPQPAEPPGDYVIRTAVAKASAVAAHSPDDAVIIAADTVVVLPDPLTILGKPADEAHALAMLRSLNGQTHQVITGCAICWKEQDNPRQDLLADVTDVTFAQWPDEILKAYASCGEPMDKAGAYAVQGAGSFLIAGISGSWSTVVGLPMTTLIRRLLHLGFIRAVC